MRFTPGYPEGEATQLTLLRGYFVFPDRDAGYGLRIPTDLRSIDADADRYSENLAIWYSAAAGRYWALCYDSWPTRQEWYGFRLRARNAARAREELAEIMAEDHDAPLSPDKRSVTTGSSRPTAGRDRL